MNQTIFDKIIAKEIPADIILETEHFIAFKDINPQAKIHVLVVPKFRIQNFSKLLNTDNNQIAEYIKGIASTAKALQLEADGYRVIFNTNHNARQTVDYIHAHILGGGLLTESLG